MPLSAFFSPLLQFVLGIKPRPAPVVIPREQMQRILSTAVRYCQRTCVFGARTSYQDCKKTLYHSKDNETKCWTQEMVRRNRYGDAGWHKPETNVGGWRQKKPGKLLDPLLKVVVKWFDEQHFPNFIRRKRRVFLALLLQAMLARLNRTGCCGVQSALLFWYLIEHHHQDINSIKLVHGKYCDHCFVLVNCRENCDLQDSSTWGEAAWVVDPWAKEVYPASSYTKEMSRTISKSLSERKAFVQGCKMDFNMLRGSNLKDVNDPRLLELHQLVEINLREVHFGEFSTDTMLQDPSLATSHLEYDKHTKKYLTAQYGLSDYKRCRAKHSQHLQAVHVELMKQRSPLRQSEGKALQ